MHWRDIWIELGDFDHGFNYKLCNLLHTQAILIKFDLIFFNMMQLQERTCHACLWLAFFTPLLLMQFFPLYIFQETSTAQDVKKLAASFRRSNNVRKPVAKFVRSFSVIKMHLGGIKLHTFNIYIGMLCFNSLEMGVIFHTIYVCWTTVFPNKTNVHGIWMVTIVSGCGQRKNYTAV